MRNRNIRLQALFASVITAAGIAATTYAYHQTPPAISDDPDANKLALCLLDVFKTHAPAHYPEIEKARKEALTPEQRGDFGFLLVLEAQSLSEAGVIKEEAVMACFADMERKRQAEEAELIKRLEAGENAPAPSPAAP